MIQLSAKDASFLHLDTPSTPWNGGVVFVYDPPAASGSVSFQDVFDHFRERLHLVDVLRMKLVKVPGDLDRPYWVEDPDLDLEYHIRRVALPSPGDWRQFCIQISEHLARPLDLTRPPWELHVVEGLDNVESFSKGSFALILKVHHSALDGKAFLAIMGVLHGLEPTSAPPPPPDASRQVESEPSSFELLTRAGVHAAQAPFAAARALGATLPGMGRAALPGIWHRIRRDVEPRAPIPQTRFNVAVGPHRSWGACFFDLADAQAFRAAVEGATVGDVATSVFGGALRKYLDKIGELPTEPLKAAVVMNVRVETDHAALGNQISAMFANLATDIGDPIERLAAVRESTRAAKNTAATIGTRRVSELLDLIPEIVITPAVKYTLGLGNKEKRGLLSRFFNTAVTGMPGPPAALYLGDAKMTHVIGFGPITDGLGLINIHSSYDRELVMTFCADRELMPDPHRYEECIYEAFDDLRQAVGSGREH